MWIKSWFRAKPRVKVDALVIGSFMVTTAICLFVFPTLFFEGAGVGDYFDVLGFFCIIIGVLLRMSARGYKKFTSLQGTSLVTGGPYKFVRNPMYLGTFLITIGFLFPLYPWWLILIFGCVFYLRYVIEIRREELWLRQNFGAQYEEYCRRIPSFFPTLASFRNARLKDIFQPEHLRSTKEKYALVYLPLVSVAVELIVEHFLLGRMDLVHALINLLIAAAICIAIVSTAETTS